jgi:hypothetical protein
MHCDFCFNIDVDQLATKEGYQHHPSAASLYASAQRGCESCNLIWTSQYSFTDNRNDELYDLGPLATQIVARAGWGQGCGSLDYISYRQEDRMSTRDRSFKLNCDLAIAMRPGLAPRSMVSEIVD